MERKLGIASMIAVAIVMMLSMVCAVPESVAQSFGPTYVTPRLRVTGPLTVDGDLTVNGACTGCGGGSGGGTTVYGGLCRVNNDAIEPGVFCQFLPAGWTAVPCGDGSVGCIAIGHTASFRSTNKVIIAAPQETFDFAFTPGAMCGPGAVDVYDNADGFECMLTNPSDNSGVAGWLYFMVVAI